MSRRPVLVVTLALLGSLSVAPLFSASAAGQAKGKTVSLPKNSVDGLAAAIAAAGPGGTVVVQPGMHFESGPVTVGITVNILGRRGAVLVSATTPDPAYVIVEAALHVKGAPGTVVEGLGLRPSGSDGGNTAILIENANDVRIARNTISGYEGGVLIQNGDRASITGNTISASVMGIVDINGAGALIRDNNVSDVAFGFGIWACDLNGRASHNVVSNSFIGIIACKVPPGGFIIDGVPVGSINSGAGWIIRDNLASGNQWGYLVIDGANGNTFANNAASGSAVYDMELSGDSFRFGFLTPMSFNNVVDARRQNISIKDCGLNNTIRGGLLIDTALDPCF
jgi:parallel beta-helix repeat protein